MGRGDVLARGARSATFGGPLGVSQSKWDAIWACDHETENQGTGKYKTDNHVCTKCGKEFRLVRKGKNGE